MESPPPKNDHLDVKYEIISLSVSQVKKDYVNLMVKYEGRENVFFRIKYETALEKLMKYYCERQSLDLNSINFLFDGLELRGDQTPEELEMDDGDEIHARPKVAAV